MSVIQLIYSVNLIAGHNDEYKIEKYDIMQIKVLLYSVTLDRCLTNTLNR